jgi:ornithine carbamoyltransferase
MSKGRPCVTSSTSPISRASSCSAILRTGEEIKARRRTPAAAGDRLLEGKVIAMIFEQPSLRTRVSFDVGIRELGGSPMMVAGHEIELGERETIADTARVLSRYVDAIMIRILDHDRWSRWRNTPPSR